MKAPPRGGIACRRHGRQRPGSTARARRHVEDAHFEHIARFGIIDKNRTGADMDAKTLAGAAPVDRRVERSSIAAVDCSPVRHVQRNTLSAPGSPAIMRA